MLSNVKKINAAKQLRRIVMSDDVTFMIDEEVINHWGDAAYNATELIPALVQNVQPVQVLDVSEDGSLYVIEGAFGTKLAIEYEDDVVDVRFLEENDAKYRASTPTSVVLIPDSLFDVGGGYQVSMLVGATMRTFNFPGTVVSDGCVEVDTTTYLSIVNRFVSDTVQKLPVHRTRGVLFAREGAYTSYAQKVHDQISVMVGTIRLGNLQKNDLLDLVQVLDAKIREAKLFAFYDEVVTSLRNDFPKEDILLGIV